MKSETSHGKNIRIMLIIILTIGIIVTTTLMAEPSYGRIRIGGLGATAAAPIAISGDNLYISWWSNETGNDEVLIRSSSDGGTTFADKLNLSNSTDTDSQDVGIAADGDNVIVTWWERNQTAEEPVMRVSNDNGETFGPLLKLATNGTIG